MKKFIITFILCLSLALTSIHPTAQAEEFNDIKQVVSATVLGCYDLDCTDISVKEFLNELNESYYYCEFDTNGSSGYAIVNNEIIVEKLWLDNTEYKDAEYIGSGGFEEHTVSISYADRTESANKLALNYPAYNLTVSCVPKAAAFVIGFYDRYYPNLYPNFEPGQEYYGYYSYTNVTNSYIIEEVNQLATDMGETATDSGVTVNEFKSGFQRFCSKKSLTATYTSCMSYGSFNFNTAKAQLSQNKPLIIFMSEYNITYLSDSNNVDTATMYTSTVPHAMAAFGYKSVTYTFSNGQTRVDNYMQVSTGITSMRTALLNLQYYIDIDDAYAVSIA